MTLATPEVHTVSLEALNGAAPLVRMAADLRSVAQAGGSVHLDLGQLSAGDSATYQRDSILWAAVLSNLLQVEFGGVDLRITLPDNPTQQLLLQRGGLWFALTTRSGNWELTNAPRQLADPWREPLKLVHGIDAPEAPGARTRIFVNPHKLGVEWVATKWLPGVALPWLGSVVTQPREPSLLATRRELIDDVTVALVELLQNIPAHAFNPRDVAAASALRPDLAAGHRFSLCELTKTKGGSRSYDRLHLVVMDNGYSIPRTIRWQWPDVQRVDAGKLLLQVIAEGWKGTDHPDDGPGLYWANRVVERYRERDDDGPDIGLRIVTEDDLTDDGAVVVEPGPVIGRAADLPVRGTVVILTLPLPRGGE